MTIASTHRTGSYVSGRETSAPALETGGPRPLIAAGLAALSLLCGIAVVYQLDGARFERFEGHLQARSVAIAAPFPAQIERILAPTGTTVKPGDAIVRLKDDVLVAAVESAGQTVASLDKELVQTEAKYQVELEWRLRSIRAEMFETKIKSATFLKQKLSHQIEELAWKTVAEDEDAVAEPKSAGLIDHVGFRNVSPRDARVETLLKSEAAKNAEEVSTAQVDLCDRRLAELEKLERSIPDQVRKSIGIELIEQRLHDARQALATLEARQAGLTLTATSVGVVGVYQAKVGQQVQAHEPLVQLLDNDQPWLALEVPSARIAEFRAQEVVTLVFPGDVERKGRIEQIPPQTSGGTASGDAVVVVPVGPAGKLWPTVPVGSRVDVLRSRFTPKK
jgi:multidrug efflux pump subunit AcrA (membrane-fusion protein)